MSTLQKSTLLLFLMLSSNGFSQDWLTDISEAKSLAKSSKKPIVLVFSGSDWCAPCMKLDKEMFKTSVFKSYAQDNLILVKADFPRRKKNALTQEQQLHNNALAERYNPNGFFPLVLVLDQEGNVLNQTGYQKITPEKFIKTLTSYSK